MDAAQDDVPYAAMESEPQQFENGPQPDAVEMQEPPSPQLTRTRTMFASVQDRFGDASAKLSTRIERARSNIQRGGVFAWAVFASGVCLELFSALLPVFVLRGYSDTWKLYVWSTLARIAIWFVVATIVAPDIGCLVHEFFKFDTLWISALGSAVGYAYMTHYSEGDFEWRRAATFAYFCYLFFFLGYFRVMTQFFPMTKAQWFIYKAVRVVVIIFFLITEIHAQLESIDGSATETNLIGQKRRAMQLILVGLTFNFIYDTCVRVMEAMQERAAEIDDALASGPPSRRHTMRGRDLEMGSL
eukprot:Amastigsp_a175273_216.p1 type:complete len:301 gc:universal Amastigsp_a175273_216:934-32(-)